MTLVNTGDLRRSEKKFRPELEGVRAVAALLVAIYHIWLGSVSGGVDVFFIVSGYLITTSLLSRMERDGTIHLSEYLLNLGKRLLPLALIVLLFSTILSFLLLPQVQWKQIMSEIYASAFYFQNWLLATNAVDYLAQNNAASPLQHFWALSIQGQFYLTWPLIIFIAFVFAKKVFKTPLRKTLLFVLITIFITSLTYSIFITSQNQPWAYFDTFARVWEFSLGGILALLLPYLSLNKMASTIIGWAGLSIIAFTGILLPVSNVFPGYAALLPISGVVLIIIASENGTKFGVEKLLGSKPLMFFGSISYGFYLWHWPLLIFYYAYFGTDSVTILWGMAILSLTFLLSILSTKLVESPIRGLSLKQSKRKIAFVLLLFLLPVLAANSYWDLHLEQVEEAFRQQAVIEDYPGAHVLFKNVVAAEDVQPIGTPLDANSSMPTYHDDGCFVRMDDPGVKVCSYGETNNPDFVIGLVGGSRTGHWFTALEEFAEELNLQIDVYNKNACRFSTQDFDGLLRDSCVEWNEHVVEPLLENPPDLIFTTANVSSGATIPDGYIEMWEKFVGISTIFGIRDNPSMPEDIPKCVEVNGAEDCAVPRENVLSENPPWENTEGLPSNVYFADLTDYLCDDELCHAVIGNVLVYRDRYHLSTLYVSTLADPLKDHIVKALEQVDQQGDS
ncbi:acyltransferase family protein [Evansella sp. AB-rgal1]|uniref:acyltransferase family protein n=1 Tax=Evansella sp. AB-rgal1 TaxID=3242696 RepID=UPI00359CD42B